MVGVVRRLLVQQAASESFHEFSTEEVKTKLEAKVASSKSGSPTNCPTFIGSPSTTPTHQSTIPVVMMMRANKSYFILHVAPS